MMKFQLQKRMEFYGVVVGQCENLVVEEGGILVVDTDRLQLGHVRLPKYSQVGHVPRYSVLHTPT